MAKRFIDTNLFDDPWFMDLSPSAKLLWIYSITKCNHAGIFELNHKLCTFQTGIGKSLLTVRQELGNRWITLDCGKIFMPSFINFQYPKGLHGNVLVQASVIKELLKYGLWDGKNMTLGQDLANSSLTVKEKEEVMVKVKEKEKEKEKLQRDNKLSILQNIWNTKCPNLKKVLENPKDRQAKEKTRLKERDLSVWKGVFVAINQSDFCCGINDSNWQATYDWIMSNEKNAIKVLEGNYDNRQGTDGTSPTKSGKKGNKQGNTTGGEDPRFHGLDEKDYTDGAINP